MKKNDTLIVIPTYKEAENIGSLLLRVMRDVPDVDILVVDDSSPDGTAKIVSRFIHQDKRIRLLSRSAKGGIAGAFIAGFTWACEHHYQHIIQMDGDFSHNPVYLHPLLEGLSTHDVVMGTRYMKGGGSAGWVIPKKLIGRFGNSYARLILKMPYQDLTGGYIAWSRYALEQLDFRTIQSQSYAFQVELKYRAHKAGLRIKEIPIYFDLRKHGRTKLHSHFGWNAAFRILQLRRG